MSEFEFDDVIRTARVIVNPEASAAELKQLRLDLAGVNAAYLGVCGRNEELRADLAATKAELAEARKVIEIYANAGKGNVGRGFAKSFISTHPAKEGE